MVYKLQVYVKGYSDAYGEGSIPLSTDGGDTYPDLPTFKEMVNDFIKDNMGFVATEALLKTKTTRMDTLKWLFPDLDLESQGNTQPICML